MSLPGLGAMLLGANAGLAPLVILGVVLLGLAAAFGMALSGVYQAALYRYATLGQASPEYFQPGLLEDSFRR